MNNNWKKGCDFGFKVGQKAWSNRFGWGKISQITESYTVQIQFYSDSGDCLWCYVDGRWGVDDLYPSLFHVEQTFDYSRPKWQPKPGELCWVWNSEENYPTVRVFKEKSSGNYFFEGVKNKTIGLGWEHFAPFDGKLPDEFKHLEGGSK